MSSKGRRLGIVTGGGDCPGLNAVIRAVTKDALRNGFEVLGIRGAFAGLIEGWTHPLRDEDVSGILNTGGTILGTTNRSDPRSYEAPGNPGQPTDRTADCVRNATKLGLEALVVIGGDGTQTIAAHLNAKGLPCVGVPKTIDNDVQRTELTFGFLTAAAIATEALDRVHTTAESHQRILIVEVMGRDAGWIALHAGIAGGADIILIPEIAYTYDHVVDAIDARAARGKRYTIVCAAEGASEVGAAKKKPGGVAEALADRLGDDDRVEMEARYVVLGHTQRGGTPIAADRVLATAYGDHAIELVKRGAYGRMAAMQDGKIVDVALDDVAGAARSVPVDHPLVDVARSVYASFGDGR